MPWACLARRVVKGMAIARTPDWCTLEELSEGQRRSAMTRLQVLVPHLHEGVPVTRVAAAAGVPLRTMRRWLGGVPRPRVAPGWRGHLARIGRCAGFRRIW